MQMAFIGTIGHLNAQMLNAKMLSGSYAQERKTEQKNVFMGCVVPEKKVQRLSARGQNKRKWSY